ncbi:nucleotidyltransferase family protein [Aurantibacillus circumpalustris]|uniref:nucleotidyltransferase family protein n=1 Tax=Aurantibacillus circumpalustris TaxID=3036359 RepID=UPI00295A7F43|nr:nucleotidyltransferase family protein [Aurantibacillus circumpalustris]
MLRTAIILAGGFGTRLQSVVSDLPKPMAPINQHPFLNYQLNYLKHYGIKNIILSVGYLSDKIKEYYKSEYNGLQIKYVVEEIALGTGGGIRLGMESCKDDYALVLNGDSLFDVDIHEFFRLHVNELSQFSIALRKVENASRYGAIETDKNDRIISFKEKVNVESKGLINGGVYILNKEVYLKTNPSNTNFSIEKDFFEKQLNKLKIKGFEFNGYFIDIGVPEDYKKAQDDFKEFKYR